MKWLIAIFLSIIMASCSCSTAKKENFTEPQYANTVKDINGNVFYTGLKVPVGFNPQNVISALKTQVGALPETFDWRTKVTLAPAESQGNCGSCWSFSSTATFQDVLRIKGEIRDLSEQYLLSCTKPGDWNCTNGGFFAHDMHMQPKGGVDAKDYPYTASDTPCKSGLTYHQQIAKWSYLVGKENPTVDEIKSAIFQYGPVSVGVGVDSAFSSYTGGIFKDTGYRQLNHAVNIVGWGPTYWIMRNSWGNWGINGYMNIEFGANGIGAWANFVEYIGTGPQPTPNPTPDPTPTPTPPPGPDCKPKPVASTGFGPSIWLKVGQGVKIGMKPRVNTTYYWTAEPAFDGGAKPEVSMINFKPSITKVLTIHATNPCGEAVATTKVNVSKNMKNVKEEITIFPDVK
jgi:C1A family cysteine protease